MERSEIVSFGAWLKCRRRAMDLTQDALAAQVGCSKDLIVKIEGDARRPSREVATLLARALQLLPHEIAPFIRCARAELSADQLPHPTASLAQAASSDQEQLRSFTLTFLFTDIQGSTRLWEHSPQAMRVALARHDTLMRRIIEQHRGQVFKLVGDAVHAVFNDPADGLAAAIAAQRALRTEDWVAYGLPQAIQVRMALHSGIAQQRDGDYFGPTLNRTARIRDAGHGGQILLSAITADLVRDVLPNGTTLEELGFYHLRDLQSPERIMQACVPDLSRSFPALRTLDAQRGNLPQQFTSIIGRTQELATITSIFRQGTIRLLTITGPGGMGKTRLALQAAASLAEHYADGVWFVDLSPLSAAAQVVPAIAQALGVPEFQHQPRLATLTAFLRPRQLLLVLDNYEHVLDSAPLAAELLQSAPNLGILVTSRAALRLMGEHEYALHSLSLPNSVAMSAQPAGTDSMQQGASDAVHLFVERARAIRPVFEVNDVNISVVAEICVRLDGLPLAIELAAARIKLFSPEQLLARITQDGGLGVLTGGMRDHPARPQTIRATIAWSYQLLSPAEQALLRALAVCAGGWTLELAEALMPDNTAVVADQLTMLVEHSLVALQEEADGTLRYRMLELIRAYALEELRSAGEEQQIRRRHAAYLAAWFEASPLEVNEQAAFQMIERERANIRAALSWSLGSALPDAELGLRIVAATWEYWFNLGFISEGRQWGQVALSVCEHRPPDGLTAHVLNATTRLLFSPVAGSGLNQTDVFLMLERSLDLARTHGDSVLEAEVLRHLGENRWASGQLDEARQWFEASLAVCRTLQGSTMHRQTGWTLFVLARLNMLYGDTPGELVRLNEAQRMFEAAHDLTGQSIVALILSRVADRAGDTAASIRHLEREIMLLRHSAGGVAPHNIEESLLAYKRGEYDHCLVLLERFSAEARQYDLIDEVCGALAFKASVHLARGDLPQTIATARELVVLITREATRLDLITLPGFDRLAVIVARVAVQQVQHAAATRLLGSLNAYLDLFQQRYQQHLDPELQRMLTQTEADCRAALGDAAYSEAAAAGSAQPLLQAISAALN